MPKTKSSGVLNLARRQSANVLANSDSAARLPTLRGTLLAAVDGLVNLEMGRANVVPLESGNLTLAKPRE